MHGIYGQRKRRKSKSTTVDESSDSDADDVVSPHPCILTEILSMLSRLCMSRLRTPIVVSLRSSW
jgi:hypothetical protein